MLAGIEATPGLQLRLHAGQSWRAPAPLRLQIMALGGPARLRWSQAPAALAEPASPDWRARVAAFFSTRRTLRT
ncbi:hypothetical protein D3C78_1667490 [compost metagenome]